MFMNIEGYEAAASSLTCLQFKLGDKAPKMIWTYFSEGGVVVQRLEIRSFRRFNDCFRSDEEASHLQQVVRRCLPYRMFVVFETSVFHNRERKK